MNEDPYLDGWDRRDLIGYLWVLMPRVCFYGVFEDDLDSYGTGEWEVVMELGMGGHHGTRNGGHHGTRNEVAMVPVIGLLWYPKADPLSYERHVDLDCLTIEIPIDLIISDHSKERSFPLGSYV